MNKKTQSTIRNMKDLLPQYLFDVQEKLDQKQNQIFDQWPKIIGSKFAPLTKPLTFQNGMLKIEVKSASLYSLLVQTEQRRLLTKLQNQFPKVGIKRLLFCIG